MGKIVCQCQKEFDSNMEYQMHWSHCHRGLMPKPLVQSSPVHAQVETAKPKVAKVEEVEKVEEEADVAPEYALATSKEGLGELIPVIKDKFGNIIDGFHRKGENANWREETLDWIDTPEKLEAARLAVNFARRKMAPEEIRERVTFLVSKAKMSTEQIAKLTGISERTVLKYMPQEFKNQKKVEAGLTPKAFSAEGLQHTVKTSDSQSASIPCTKPEDFSVEETVKPEVIPEGTPICPVCQSSMDLTEYEEIKKVVAKKFGKQTQTLLFSVVN